MTKETDSGKRGRQGGAEIEITPKMIAAGYKAFDAWASEWDYFFDGPPPQREAERAVAAIMRSMVAANPDFLKKALSST